MTEKKYWSDRTLLLQERCIAVIENELNVFFADYQINAETIKNYSERDSIKPERDTPAPAGILDKEIKSLIKVIENKLKKEINLDFILAGNIPAFDAKDMEYLNYNIKEFENSERVFNFCEKMLEESIAVILDTFFSNNIVSYFMHQLDITGLILKDYSMKNQKARHGAILSQQMKGAVLNLRMELRNSLVKSVLIAVSSLESYLGEGIVA